MSKTETAGDPPQEEEPPKTAQVLAAEKQAAKEKLAALKSWDDLYDSIAKKHQDIHNLETKIQKVNKEVQDLEELVGLKRVALEKK